MGHDSEVLAEAATCLAILEPFFVWNERTIQGWLRLHVQGDGWLGHDPSGDAATACILRFATAHAEDRTLTASELFRRVRYAADASSDRYDGDANRIIGRIREVLAEHDLDRVFRWRRTLLPLPPESPPPVAHTSGVFTRHWTVKELYRAVSLRLFPASERMELVRGELFLCKTMTPSIASALSLCREALRPERIDDAHIRQRLPLFVGYDGLPEPSLAVVRGTPKDYAHQHPLPSDVLLVIEVSNAESLAFDRGRKAAYYSEVELPEYWIVNLEDRQIEIYRNPGGDAPTDWGFDYKSVQIARHGDKIAPGLLPEMLTSVDDLLPRP